jgi:hypothetical protein
MKKVLLSSLALFLFSASIFMFQLSCSKDANAGGSGGAGSTSLASKILYKIRNQNTICIKNADGSGNTTFVNVQMPSGYSIKDSDESSIQSDGSFIYFNARNTSNTSSWDFFVFRCDMNGNNVKQLTTETSTSGMVSIF